MRLFLQAHWVYNAVVAMGLGRCDLQAYFSPICDSTCDCSTLTDPHPIPTSSSPHPHQMLVRQVADDSRAGGAVQGRRCPGAMHNTLPA